MPSFLCVTRPLAGALAASAAALIGGAALAEPAPPFAVLLDQARAAAPRLAESHAEIDQAQGLARQAAVRPNPVARIEVENFAGSGPFEGLRGAETTAAVEQTLELGGKRPARIAAGRAAVAAAVARSALTRVEFAAQLALAYAEAEAAIARVIQGEDLLTAAQTDATTARELVDAGREPELRALQASAELEAARAELEEGRAARDTALVRLSSLAGSPGTFDGLSESLLSRSATSMAVTEPSAPAVAAARAERDAAAARIRVERLRRIPDIAISGGVRRLSGEDATAFVAGVSVPLPLFDRNRGATAAAQAELRAAEARLRQAELTGLADLQAARLQTRSATARLEAAGAGETTAAEAYRLARLGYEAGRLSLLELTTARRALATARVRTLEARLARIRAEVEIARLTGRPPFGA